MNKIIRKENIGVDFPYWQPQIFPVRKFVSLNRYQNTSAKTEGRQESQAKRAKRALSIIEEFVVDSGDFESGSFYRELNELIQKKGKVNSYWKPASNIETLIESDLLEEGNKDEDEAVFYQESENQENIESFLSVIKSAPAENHEYEYIYTDEELDDF